MKCELCEEVRGIQSCHIIPRMCDGLFGNFDVKFNVLNRLYLCPNHHWYFDHNLLSEEERLRIKDKILMVLNRFFVLVEELYEKLKQEGMGEFDEFVRNYQSILYKNKTIKNFISIDIKK